MSSDLPPAEPTKSNPFRDAPIATDKVPVLESNKVITAEISAAQDELGRLHPMSLMFDVMSHVRSLLIPAVIAVFSAAKVGGLSFAAMIFVPTVIQAAIKYFSLRYQIRESELIVTQGIFFVRDRNVPIERIQNVNLIQNPLHRLFNVAEVRIETASGTEPEATLRVLSMPKIEQLRRSIFEQRNQPSQAQQKLAANDELPGGDGNQDATVEEPQESERDVILSLPSNLLLRAGLASNKGTLLIGVLIGIYFQFDEQLKTIVDIEQIARSAGEGASRSTIIWVATTAVIGVFLFFRLLGMAWYILRFFGYQLTSSGEDFRIRCGLFTKVSASVPRKRIQFISIHRNLFMRWLKLATIRIETAGGAGRGQEDATKTVSSRWFIPVLPESQVREIIETLRPGLNWEEESFDWQPISPRAGQRLARIAVFTSILISAVSTYYLWPWGWALGVAAAPLLVFLALKRAKSRKYARAENVVVYRSGIFTKKTSLTFFEKIQTVRVDETPFDRRWKMASLCIDTAASGPADHRICIDYLTNDFAYSEFDAIVKESSEQLPVFS